MNDNGGATSAVLVNGEVVGDVSLSSTTGNVAVNIDNSGLIDGNVDLDGVLDLAANANITGTVTTANDVTTSGADAEVGNLVVTGSNNVSGANGLTVTNNITINSGTMTTAGAITAGNVTINTGNGLILSAGHTLTIKDGSFTNDAGTFTAFPTSVLAFTGTNASGQLIPGSNFEVGGITVNKAGQTLTLTDDASLTASGVPALTVTAGTFNLQNNTITIDADGEVLVDADGTIESDTPTEGGVIFTDDGATIGGKGYSNIIINTGMGNSVELSSDVTFSGNLTFISGLIFDFGGNDISPEQANQTLHIDSGTFQWYCRCRYL